MGTHQQPILPIVVVEDETDIRALLVQILTLYIGAERVHAFPKAEDALPLLHQESIGLLITDYNLPGINGVGLMCILKAIAPATPVAIITGYFSATVQREALAAGATHVLAKPFALEQIDALLQAVYGPLAPWLMAAPQQF